MSHCDTVTSSFSQLQLLLNRQIIQGNKSSKVGKSVSHQMNQIHHLKTSLLSLEPEKLLTKLFYFTQVSVHFISKRKKRTSCTAFPSPNFPKNPRTASCCFWGRGKGHPQRWGHSLLPAHSHALRVHPN